MVIVGRSIRNGSSSLLGDKVRQGTAEPQLPTAQPKSVQHSRKPLVQGVLGTVTRCTTARAAPTSTSTAKPSPAPTVRGEKAGLHDLLLSTQLQPQEAYFFQGLFQEFSPSLNVGPSTPLTSDRDYWDITQLLFSLLSLKAVLYEGLLATYSKVDPHRSAFEQAP